MTVFRTGGVGKKSVGLEIKLLVDNGVVIRSPDGQEPKKEG